MTDKPLTPRERVDGWAVMIEVNGELVLTISHNHLAGIPDIEKYQDVVLRAAEHLRSFIGAHAIDRQLAAELEEANRRAEAAERQLAAKTAECDEMFRVASLYQEECGKLKHDIERALETSTELATECERFRREADNLARMLRRGQWLAKKETGDTGLKVWAGQAYDLLDRYGRLGSPLRDEEAAIDAARKETP